MSLNWRIIASVLAFSTKLGECQIDFESLYVSCVRVRVCVYVFWSHFYRVQAISTRAVLSFAELIVIKLDRHFSNSIYIMLNTIRCFIIFVMTNNLIYNIFYNNFFLMMLNSLIVEFVDILHKNVFVTATITVITETYVTPEKTWYELEGIY